MMGEVEGGAGGQGGRLGRGRGIGIGRSSAGISLSCQDCGNQAKKDCSHMRCRTCCKGRGFQCQTHVKSTWIPVYNRSCSSSSSSSRSRSHSRHHHNTHQQHPLPTSNTVPVPAGPDPDPDPHHHHHLLLQPHINPNPAASACTPPPATAAAAVAASSSSGSEARNFPAEVSSPAMFRRVRVSSIDNAVDDQYYAYQTAVIIGGHIFKGILYDEGPEFQFVGAAAPRRGTLFPQLLQQHPPNPPIPPPPPPTFTAAMELLHRPPSPSYPIHTNSTTTAPPVPGTRIIPFPRRRS